MQVILDHEFLCRSLFEFLKQEGLNVEMNLSDKLNRLSEFLQPTIYSMTFPRATFSTAAFSKLYVRKFLMGLRNPKDDDLSHTFGFRDFIR